MRERIKYLLYLFWISVIIQPRAISSYGKTEAHRKKTVPNHKVSLGQAEFRTQVSGFSGSFSHEANIRGIFFVTHQVFHVLFTDWPNINYCVWMIAVPLGQVQASVICPLFHRICMGSSLHPTLIYNNSNYHFLSTTSMLSSVLDTLLTYHLVLW